MPLSDSQVKALKAAPRRQSKSVGDSLILVIESEGRGGGKSFEGRLRFPPGRAGKQVPVRIGPYGKGPGKWSLKEGFLNKTRSTAAQWIWPLFNTKMCANGPI
jgi:hypothetical protein